MLDGSRIVDPNRSLAVRAALGRARSVDQAPLMGRELDDTAFGLIKGFVEALRDAPDVQRVVTQAYFGDNYGYPLLDESSRDVGVWRGNIFWLIRYDFSPVGQTLRVVREVHASSGDLKPLRSRTLEAESSRRRGLVGVHRLDELAKFSPARPGVTSRKNVGDHSFPPRHDREAVYEGEELLRDFKSSS